MKLLISGFYPFEELVRAYKDLDARHSRGKIIIGMNTVAPRAAYLSPKMRAYAENATADKQVPALQVA